MIINKVNEEVFLKDFDPPMDETVKRAFSTLGQMLKLAKL